MNRHQAVKTPIDFHDYILECADPIADWLTGRVPIQWIQADIQKAINDNFWQGTIERNKTAPLSGTPFIFKKELQTMCAGEPLFL